MRWTALNQGKIFVKKSSMNITTVEDLRLILQSNDNRLTDKIMFYGSNIRGTKAYWYKRCGELLDMVNQIGTPTIFFTLSAAELHWPDLYRLLAPASTINGEILSDRERRILMCENALVVATFFEERLKLFVEQVMEKFFKISDSWFRFESQHRGSPHVHGVFWIENAPDVTDYDKKSEQEQLVIIKYFDELVSARDPDKLLPPLSTHPCQNDWNAYRQMKLQEKMITPDC